MVGNDIVDLAAAEKESNWRRSGFLEKVFTAKEQAYISNFHNQHLMVWLLWSMKESAYKIFVQENFTRLLAPLKFQCNINTDTEGNFSGEVLLNKNSYSTFSKISSEKISTTAYSKTFPVNFLSGDLIFSKTRQNEIIFSFFSEISENFNIPSGDLSIKKDDFNIPYLLHKGEHLKSSISFSHHGRFGAYAAEFF
ncbi:MAG: 4'-phosphopantetheinyl transferase superfamily protein [Ignavibacteria bacterium]